MKTLLLLHGALGARSQLEPLRHSLSNNYIVHSFTFTGHGGQWGTDKFSIDFFAKEVVEFCEREKIKNVVLFGYSMGGYIALYVARHYPELVSAVITLGTKLYWDRQTAAKETAMLNPEKTEQKVPAFAKQLQRLHQPQDWKNVMNKTAAMLTQMGEHNPLQPGEYKHVQTNILLMLGDRDKMVTLNETVEAYRQFPAAQLCILPRTAHPIELLNTEMAAFHIRQFAGL